MRLPFALLVSDHLLGVVGHDLLCLETAGLRLPVVLLLHHVERGRVVVVHPQELHDEFHDSKNAKTILNIVFL